MQAGAARRVQEVFSLAKKRAGVKDTDAEKESLSKEKGNSSANANKQRLSAFAEQPIARQGNPPLMESGALQGDSQSQSKMAFFAINGPYDCFQSRCGSDTS